MTMRIALLLPDSPVAEPRMEQRIAGLHLRFGAEAEIACVSLSVGAAGAQGLDRPVTRIRRASELGRFDCVACFWEDEAATKLAQVSHRVSFIWARACAVRL